MPSMLLGASTQETPIPVAAMKTFPTSTLIVASVLIAGTKMSGAITLFANITHDQETVQGPLLTTTGAPRPLSFGSAEFVLNDAMTALTFTATIFNIDVTGTQTPDINDNLVAAHVHAAANAAVGINSPVVWGFFGTPDNDNNPDDLLVTPFGTGVGGTFSSKWDLIEGNGANNLLNQLPNIFSSHSYINFHTVQFGGGEIRGTITPVPEGGVTAVMLGFSLLGIHGLRRKWIIHPAT